MTQTSTSKRGNLSNRLLLIYFGSGFAALLYQIVWQRWLVFYTGMSTESISLIVSAFMAGLGIGYLWGGWVADRSTQRQNLRYFVLAEIGIGIFALLSKAFLYDYLYQQNVLQTSSWTQTYLILFGVLLIPTSLMGFSLPVLSKAVDWDNIGEQARYIGRLYFINTLGAAFGAWLTGVWLVKYLGFEQTVWVGACLNFACAIGGYLLLQRQATHTPILSVTPVKQPFGWNPLIAGWALQYAWSGFAALTLELIWFRILELMVKSVSVTFAILLGIYLSGLAVGTYVGARWRGSVSESKKRFWWAQAVIYVYTVFSLLLLLYSLQHVGFLESIRAYLERYEPTWSVKSRVMIYLTLPIFLLWLPTFLMGVSFSQSQVIIQDSQSQVGRRVGWLQFANIVGSTLGAWMIAFVGFEKLGTATSLQWLLGAAMVYVAILYFSFQRQRAWHLVLVLGMIGVGIFLLPNNFRFWRILNGLKTDAQFFYDEDRTGLSIIKAYPPDTVSEGFVFANGLGQSKLPFFADPMHVALGLIPTFLHPAPKHIAVIGLGSGGTLLGVCARPEVTARIDCFELMANQGKVLQNFAQKAHLDVVTSLLSQPHVHLHWRDGRYALRSQSQHYDLIEADALRPMSAYAGNLYSKAYFELLKSRLNSGGMAVSWHATPRTRQTMMTVFPYVYGNEHVLIGMDRPLQWNSLGQTRYEALAQHPLYQQAHINPVLLINQGLATFVTYQAGRLLQTTDVNTDLFPRDEFNY